MKSEARNQLIKDIIFAVVAWLVFGFAFSSIGGLGAGGFLVSLFCASVPFGWRWLSKVFISVSWQMVIFKFILSILVGWVAIFVVIIKDILAFISAE